MIAAASMAGVLGIARITPRSQPAPSSMARVFTEAAKESSSLAGFSAGAISAITAGTWVGFTPSRMMSANCAAARLSVPTSTPNCTESALARSGCCTVATSCSGRSKLFLRNACSKMPPILPAPRMATRRLVVTGAWTGSSYVSVLIQTGYQTGAFHRCGRYPAGRVDSLAVPP